MEEGPRRNEENVDFSLEVIMQQPKSGCTSRLPQRLKSTIFEKKNSLQVPYGEPSTQKDFKNIDFSLWGYRATTQTHFGWLHDYLKDYKIKVFWKKFLTPRSPSENLNLKNLKNSALSCQNG